MGLLGYSPELWRKVISEMIFRLLDKIIEEYVGLSRSLSAPLETPKWGATKIEFGEHQG